MSSFYLTISSTTATAITSNMFNCFAGTIETLATMILMSQNWITDICSCLWITNTQNAAVISAILLQDKLLLLNVQTSCHTRRGLWFSTYSPLYVQTIIITRDHTMQQQLSCSGEWGKSMTRCKQTVAEKVPQCGENDTTWQWPSIELHSNVAYTESTHLHARTTKRYSEVKYTNPVHQQKDLSECIKSLV